MCLTVQACFILPGTFLMLTCLLNSAPLTCDLPGVFQLLGKCELPSLSDLPTAVSVSFMKSGPVGTICFSQLLYNLGQYFFLISLHLDHKAFKLIFKWFAFLFLSSSVRREGGHTCCIHYYICKDLVQCLSHNRSSVIYGEMSFGHILESFQFVLMQMCSRFVGVVPGQVLPRQQWLFYA